MMPIEFDFRHFLKNLTSHPGVYQMLGENAEILYVGKARNLKKRVASYFRGDTKNPRIASLVRNIRDIKIIVTNSDYEALLLENNLIKQYKPRYNVVFRDDKSYVYIFLAKNIDFPRIDIYRGKKQPDGYYYGPYSSVSAVRESISSLQKLFKIRQCEDTFFRNRKRPCIQYQIKRCTAPCVAYISKEKYQQDVQLARLFLEGKNQELIAELTKKMEAASIHLEYEEAARFRDQVASLRKIQERQYIYHDSDALDVIAVTQNHSVVCMQVLLFRAGKLVGNRAYFPKVTVETTDEDIVAEFLSQYYSNEIHQEDIPKQILLNVELTEIDYLEQLLSEIAKHKVSISKPVRGDRVRLVAMALNNAKNALKHHLTDKNHFAERLESLQQALQLNSPPQRIECFDISHTQGEATIASCVVFNEQGADRRSYRRYNITGINRNDDYAAIKQVLSRRYSKMKMAEEAFPDIVMIDGGKGQLRQGQDVFEELQISGITLLAIAKGPTRKAGFETIFIAENSHNKVVSLPENALLLLQQVRDEAHRFAITGHKKQRDKRRVTSPLEAIEGVGPQRRRELLHYFGGLQELKGASLEEIAKVKGISRSLAERIFESLHRD